MARELRWFDKQLSLNVATGGTADTVIMGGITMDTGRRSTVTRMLVTMDCHSLTVGGAWGGQYMDFGIGVTSQEASAASVLPDPDTPTEYPASGWLWKARMAVAQNGAGAPVIHRETYDIRSQRKMGIGDLFFIADNNASGVGTTFTVVVSFLIRVLVRLL